MNAYLEEKLTEVSIPLQEWLDAHMRSNPGNHKQFTVQSGSGHFEVRCVKCREQG